MSAFKPRKPANGSICFVKLDGKTVQGTFAGAFSDYFFVMIGHTSHKLPFTDFVC